MSSDGEISQLITEWRAGVAEQAARFEATRQAIDEVSVTETAANGAIVLTVDFSGIPSELRLGDDVGRMKPDQLASQIMACLHRAQARLAERVSTVVAGTVGDASGAEAIAEEYRYRFPTPPDLDDVPPPPTEENADFGMSEMVDSAAAPPVATPTRTNRRAPTQTNDSEEENWAASPW